MVDLIKKRLREHTVNYIGNIVTAGQELVSPEHEKARRDICKGCDLLEMVTLPPVPWIGPIQVPGCGGCKCPIKTKPKAVKYRNFKDGKPLEIKTNICPHPDGNKWEDVDNKYFSSKNPK